ncbi:hypothetical protein VARIO8X_110138 [Burkholderiales bacterium 8X]|nr:hypothetical protein VARIO8X_110138 [Burkholderiales bacterium 8X]
MFTHRLIDKQVINFFYYCYFIVRPGNEHNSICLQTFHLTSRQLPFLLAGLIKQHPPESITSQPSLAKTEFNQAALSCKNLRRKFSAVLAGHCTLNALNNG